MTIACSVLFRKAVIEPYETHKVIVSLLVVLKDFSSAQDEIF